LDGFPRAKLLDEMSKRGITVVFHYVPLHSSPAGLQHGRSNGPLPVTDRLSAALVRVPIWLGVEHHVDRVIEAFETVLG
jgi:dTDP-4-amino-4,6-dideoxygalactose transaminase